MYQLIKINNIEKFFLYNNFFNSKVHLISNIYLFDIYYFYLIKYMN